MDKIVIIMPTYNERENIQKMIPQLFDKYFPNINAMMHLLVVNDLDKKGLDDGTGEIVRNYTKKYKNLHLLEDKKKGLGWAYIRGMKYAINTLNADAVMEMDSDFQHPPRFVKPMVDAYLKGADYIIGSRYIKGGSVPKDWELTRKAISYFGNLFIRIVLVKPKIHDLTTGFRLTRVRGVLSKISLDNLMEPERFAYKVDLLYQSIKNAKKVVEVPLEFASRKEEKSKFSMREMVATFKVAIILGIRDKARFIKYGVVGFIGYAINAIGLYLLSRSGAPEWAAWAGSTELAIISNFILNNVWTFKEEQIIGVLAIAKKFIQFNTASLGALLIQTIAGTIGVSILGAGYRQLLLPFIVAFLVIPYNYFMYNVFIWKTWKLPILAKVQK